MTTATVTTTELVSAYYDSWQNGIGSFDEARLRQVLAPDLLFEGPIAGRRIGLDSFMPGLTGFVRSLKALRMIQQVESGTDASALYDCDLGVTGGTLRFAEFFQVENDRIQAIRLVFDTSEFKKLTT